MMGDDNGNDGDGSNDDNSEGDGGEWVMVDIAATAAFAGVGDSYGGRGERRTRDL